MKELKSYLQRSLTTSCPLKFFKLMKNAQETRRGVPTSSNFHFRPRIVQNEKKRRTSVTERGEKDWLSKAASPLAVYVRTIFKATNFDISSSIKFAMRKLNHFPNFNKLQLLTCDKFRYKSFLRPSLYSIWFTFIEFVFKIVVACSFWVPRVIKNTLKPFEFKWPEVRFNRKQAWPECH